MTSETTAKKDIQKLQRAIVDGLEDVKGQDIVVFNTESMSPLFERVIIASGTSNRQTKALAASVRDAVREAGFDKPRIEGEDNGEWIIVDCGQAVAHVMQPVIRQYYRLEEIWGAKPVRLKSAAEKAAEAREAAAQRTATRTTRKGEVKEVKPVDAKSLARKQAKVAAAAPAPASAKAAAKKTAAKPAAKSAGTPAAKAAVARVPAKKAATKAIKPKTTLAKLVVNKPKPTARTSAARKSAPKKKP
jgi:ribosome-associated protein